MNITTIINTANCNATYASNARKLVAAATYFIVALAIVFSQISFSEYLKVSLDALIAISPYILASVAIVIIGVLIQNNTRLDRTNVAFTTLTFVALCFVPMFYISAVMVIAAFGWSLLLYSFIAGVIATISAGLVLSLP